MRSRLARLLRRAAQRLDPRPQTLSVQIDTVLSAINRACRRRGLPPV